MWCAFCFGFGFHFSHDLAAQFGDEALHFFWGNLRFCAGESVFESTRGDRGIDRLTHLSREIGTHAHSKSITFFFFVSFQCERGCCLGRTRGAFLRRSPGWLFGWSGLAGGLSGGGSRSLLSNGIAEQEHTCSKACDWEQ